ncbi:MAG: hypothetical protein QOG59_3399 [Solirubrobacteraceae bacterium]|jgi:uncharacterized Ntn-hydrolase superfamily protein|nr:hypothetical protein [Solirubrobacteraceae bacterium]
MDRVRQGTYSIVARDPLNGELGVAVQSHWFSVGSVVTWAKAGVGAVATQADVEIAYGPRALELIERGSSARDALARLLSEDPSAPSRQVAVVDHRGEVAVHTGEETMAFAGHISGEAVSCQANVMADERVWPAMIGAFQDTEGRLTERLLAALDAGEAAGGDVRGRQSAAILVVPAQGASWDTVVDLRVEDDDEPLVALHRLVRLHDAYALADAGDELVGQGRHELAAEMFQKASALAPDNHELLFWAGLGAAQAGDLDTGLAKVREAIAQHPGWLELLRRLTPQIAPSAAVILERISTD